MMLGPPATQKKSTTDASSPATTTTTTTQNKIVPRSSYDVPRDIGPGLLKFCLTHTDSPNLKETVLTDRDPKDYEWLRAAFDNLEDDAKKMTKINDILKNPESTPGQRCSSLDALEFFIEDIDNAGDYIKIGGVPILLDLIKGEDRDTRARATLCLSIITQNEESIQKYLNQLGVGDIILGLLSRETNALCREKFLSLLSALGAAGLIDKDHPERMESLMMLCVSFLTPEVDIYIPLDSSTANNNAETVKETSTKHVVPNSVTGMIKATHILRKILHLHPALKAKANECGVLEALVGLVHSFNNAKVTDSHQAILCEKCEDTLLELVKGNQDNLVECKKLRLLDEVSARLKSLDKFQEEYEQELTVLRALSNLLVQ
ncbi:hypothetical protein SAMD00019534_089600, partial [Acytostelium subglobosum LB1]|uniref:hypothetical protein n=1 Tax=Acytostelium subglobosum LB1 TaxID=1410327 RepID=UPI0006451C37